MNHQTFITTLEAAADKALVFERRADDKGVRIGAGYHVTEVRAVNVRAVDCGAQEDAWAETVVQLWVPEEAEDTFMSAQKFLNILERVTANIPVTETADVRVEYGDAGAPALAYHVEGIGVGAGEVVVRLEPPHVTCKARDRALMTSKMETLSVINASDAGCCGPSSPSCCA